MTEVQLTGSLTSMVTALGNRDISAVELLGLHLVRIADLDRHTNAVVTVDPAPARAAAARIDHQRVNGGVGGRLAGVPCTIKDAIATEGLRSTGGAVELANHVPNRDADVVASLRSEGAVVFGKTNLPRWSADYQSYNELFGVTNNPWALDRTPGGSSGGAAAAVAMGFTPFEIGTDIGGSVRLPSSFCGVYGHKPTYGIVPTTGYLDNPRYHDDQADVNVFGPLARTIDDLELIFDVIAGPSPHDRPAWRLDLPPARATKLSDFRVAAWFDDALGPLAPSLDAVHTDMLGRLESAGAQINHEARPAIDPRLAARLGMALIGSATELSESEEDLVGRRAASQLLAHRDWDEMHRQRGLVRHAWGEFFSSIDILLCPVTCVPPFRHVHAEDGSNFSSSVLADYGDRPYADLLPWNALTGSAYLPVTTPPIGRTADGLPVSIQVVAPYLHDRTSLAFARCVDELFGGYEAPPLAR